MSTRHVDVTSQIRFGSNDDELLPLTQCICGAKFVPWDMMIGVYSDSPTECDECGRKFFFRNAITVYEVLEG